MNPTNVDEFLRVRKGKLVPYRRHDCLFARVEIFRHHGEQIYRLLSGQGNGNEGIPLGCVASDEDEPLPPKREDILFACSFAFLTVGVGKDDERSEMIQIQESQQHSARDRVDRAGLNYSS